jgi:uncharacterized protein YciI
MLKEQYEEALPVESEKKTFLIALPSFPGNKGFNHRTILVSAIDEDDAIALARHLKPNDNIGDVKEVDYYN